MQVATAPSSDLVRERRRRRKNLPEPVECEKHTSYTRVCVDKTITKKKVYEESESSEKKNLQGNILCLVVWLYESFSEEVTLIHSPVSRKEVRSEQNNCKKIYTN